MKKNLKSNWFIILLFPVLMMNSSCEKYLEVGAPAANPSIKESFNSENGALSAVLGVYSIGMVDDDGLFRYYTACMGASAGELDSNNPQFASFKAHNIPATNFYISSLLWQTSYMSLANINVAIDGLNGSTSLRPALKNQLLGEMYFWRAFVNFYLTNLFGNTPMPVTSLVKENATLPGSPQPKIYEQIISDLLMSQDLLTDQYPSGGYRTRVNRNVTTALLARVYLYQGNWSNAEAEASKVIASPDYRLETPDATFINSSEETIFQVSNVTGVSSLGRLFRTSAGSVPGMYLTSAAYNNLENDDLRKSRWTAKVTIASREYAVCTKYKAYSGTSNEYDIALRLGEIFLIRAEARINQDKIADGIADLNMLRERARPEPTTGNPNPLPDILTTISKSNALLAVETERFRELFGEFGHRWLDLKRTPSVSGTSGKTRADDLFGAMPGFESTDLLYPMPNANIILNPNLVQNPGYN